MMLVEHNKQIERMLIQLQSTKKERMLRLLTMEFLTRKLMTKSM